MPLITAGVSSPSCCIIGIVEVRSLLIGCHKFTCRWVSTRKTKLQCISNGLTSFLHPYKAHLSKSYSGRLEGLQIFCSLVDDCWIGALVSQWHVLSFSDIILYFFSEIDSCVLRFIRNFVWLWIQSKFYFTLSFIIRYYSSVLTTCATHGLDNMKLLP